MSNRLKAGLILLFTFLIVSSIIVFIKYSYASKQSFHEAAENLELALISDNPELFKDAFNYLIVKKLDITDSKFILNRVNRFCRKTGDYELLEKFAEKVFKRYKKDKEITAVYLYALIKNGKGKTAYSVITDYGSDSLYPELMEEINLINNKLQNKYDAYMLESLYNRTKDPRFLADAVIAEITKGNVNNPSVFALKLPEDHSGRNLLLFYSYFEEDKYQKALYILNKYDLGFEIERMMLYHADLNMYTKDYDKAEELYLTIIAKHPDVSSIPYINLAWIGTNNKQLGLGKELDRGIVSFSNDIVFLENVTAYYVSTGQKNRALEYIDKYGKDIPLLKLEALKLKGAVEPKRMIAGIQEILLKNRDDSKIGRYYCQFLYKTGNISALNEYIIKKETDGELPGWLKFYKGLVLAAGFEYDESIELLEESYKAEKQWEILFDLGILYGAEKNYLKAVEMFQSCERNVSNREKSMIRTSLAQVLYKSGNIKRAIKEVSYALDLDNNNIKAVLLLNKLESELK